MHTTSIYDFAAVGFYLVLLVALGIVFRRLNRTSDDYFRSGCRTMWWMVGASSFMTAFSAWTFTGAASQAYESGLGVSIIFYANALGFFINAALLAPWYRQIRATTLPEVLRMRYNRPTQQIYAWTGVLYSFLMSGLHLWGISIFASAVFGFPVRGSIVVIGAVTVAVATLGGSWSVMATDFIQSLILVPMTVLIAVLCLAKIGGASGMVESLHSLNLGSHLDLIQSGQGAKFTIAYTAALVLKQMLVYNGLNDAPKYFSVKDGREARMGALLAGILMLFGAAIWFIPPLYARVALSGMVEAIPMKNPSEAAFAVVSIHLLPPGLLGLMVVAMLGTTMSSMDSSLNRNAAVITRDIIKGLLFKKAGERTMFIAGQVFTILAGITVISLSLSFARMDGKGLFDLMIQIGSLLAVPKLIPLLWGIFFRNVPHWSALFSLGCGLAMSVASLVGKWNFQTTLFVNFTVGSAAFFATMPFYRFSNETYRGRVQAFFATMHRPVDFEREVGGTVDVVQFRTIGISSLVLGAFVQCLALIPGAHARWPFAFVAGSMLAVGALFLYAGRKRQPAPLPRSTPIVGGEAA